MEAIEFETKVYNGAIKIPDFFKINLNETVKVIILKEEKAKETTDSDLLNKFNSLLEKTKSYSPKKCDFDIDLIANEVNNDIS
ncbi:MAG: hypothetical protein A2086_00590 [Spirochaetes bacterium GWD1_27_9]|nr:MAG: hypothetical protein A2Z98_05100 [Spirochaetes bacterium GWB1_27_13]OHD25036.1 MAG: hypothetical protein A2Y34_03155 [Spirochaetes bacterium GWC1_27_15]OHD32507.1 MAG: hypothetical protein A2086_00590 [Spirochaetes bacterium GWD1_27_9]